MLLVLIITASAFATFAGTAQAITAQESGYETVSGHGMTIVSDGWVSNSAPINKFVVTIINDHKITVNYKNPATRLKLTVYPHNEAIGSVDFSKSVTRKAKNMKRDKDVYVDVSSLPGDTFYVMVGNSLPTEVKIAGASVSTPIEVPVENPCDTNFVTPETGDVFSNGICNWGVIEFIQDNCEEPYIRIEFESSVPEQARIMFNSAVLVDGFLEPGEHFLNIDPALLDEDFNYVDAFVGDDGQTFFMVGEVDICKEEAPEAPEAPEVPEAPEAPEVPEAPELPDEEPKVPESEEGIEDTLFNTDEVEEDDETLEDKGNQATGDGLPKTGVHSIHMVLIALALLVAGSLLLASSKIKAAKNVVA